eukprot:1161318-Pelagomonas_calceolata.AAC.1
MPTRLLAIIKSIYVNDDSILVDGCQPLQCKQTFVRPHLGVQQGCPLFPLLFPLYINDVDRLAENVQGVVTGSRELQVTNMLYAGNLCLTFNQPKKLQQMLNRLHAYAQLKGLVINVAKYVIMRNNSRGNNVPAFTQGGAHCAPVLIEAYPWGWGNVPLPTGLCCGNVDMDHCNSFGFVQQEGSTMLYSTAIAQHSARCCMGLDRYNTFTHRVLSGQPIIMREFVVDLRTGPRGVRNADALAEHDAHVNKLAKFHQWVAYPLKPWQHMLRSIARFRLRAHTLRVETSLWQEHTSECDRCNQGGLQTTRLKGASRGVAGSVEKAGEQESGWEEHGRQPSRSP